MSAPDPLLAMIRKCREAVLRVDWPSGTTELILRTLSDCQDANAALAARLAKAESDLELALGSRGQFTAERLLYLIRQDFDCLPECNSWGHAENCPYVGGPAQLDALAARCELMQARIDGGLDGDLYRSDAAGGEGKQARNEAVTLGAASVARKRN